MKRIAVILFLLACIQSAFADTRLIMVEGYCYLEGQSEHSETKVKFIKVSPSAITDSTYADSSGHFFITDLREGIYDIEYTHGGFDTVRAEDQLLVSGTTLAPVTLNWPFSDVDGYCYLEGQSEHSGTKVKFIKVSPSAITDSTSTDSSGYFMMTHLREGTCDVEYTHQGFDTVLIEDQTFVSSTTMPPVTLEHSLLSGALSGALGPGEYTIIGDISISAGDSLRLLPGTTFMFAGPYSFEIYGRLLAEGTESDSIVFTTEQSGTNRWRGLRFEGSSSSGSRLSYCLIEKGYSNNGGGVLCSSSSPVLTNCTISGNSASAIGHSSYAYGGGVYCFSSSAAFTNCTISGNLASASASGGYDSYAYGGGAYCDYYSSPTFTNCTISGNSASASGYYPSAYGGGVYCSSSSPALTNCTISGNSASASGYNSYAYGGGAYCSYSSPTFTNSTLSGNSGQYGGGVYCSYSSPTIKSTIIAFSSGSGIYFANSTTSQVEYCDIFGNSGGNFVGNGPPGIGQISTTNANCDPCDNYFNIFLDPMFADTAAEDYHLTDLSHCIGAGDPADTVSTDFEGDPRPNPPGSFPDIGTDENPNAQPPLGPCELSGPLQCILGPGVCHVIGEISIDAGDSLTLLPGTTLIFDGPYPFNIYGTLLAEGTESDSIVFTTDTLLNPDRWRGLRFQDSTSSGSRLAYCLIEKAYATGDPPDAYGGGIYCWLSAPTFANCTMTLNSAGWGGGAFCRQSSPTFTNCMFSSNSAGWGGAVHCWWDSFPTFTNCTLTQNSASGAGGGVNCDGSSPAFVNCMFIANSTLGDGGGVVAAWSSSPSLRNCTISQNSAVGNGGGVYCSNSASPTLTNCTIANNESWNGGGVFCDNSSPNFANCTVSNNFVYNVGGGMYCVGSSPTFRNCTLNGNSAGSGGGGIRCYQSSPALSSTIIAFSVGAGIYFYNSPSSQISYCDIFGNSEGNIVFSNNDPSQGPPMIGVPLVTNPNADSADIYMNIFVDPMFADTAAGDYHLTDLSHCTGAGDPEDTLSTDFEGDPRPNPPGSNPDIGMDENPHGAAIPGLVISIQSGNAALRWLPFGVSGTVYNIYGSSLPFVVGVLLHSTTNTNWTDEETSSRPSLYFYYVTMEESGRVMR